MRTSLLLATAVFLPSVAGAQIDQTLVDEFGRGILAALREGSFETLEPHVVTADDFVEIVGAMPGLSDERRASAIEGKDEFAAMVREHFVEALERAAASGIDYAQVSFVRMEAETRVPEEDPQMDPAVLADLRTRSADVNIIVSYEGEERRIALRDCFRLDRGWVLMEPATFGFRQ